MDIADWLASLGHGEYASSRATVVPGSSLNRPASTQPADPAPTIT